jgi:PEP-CTERM motif
MKHTGWAAALTALALSGAAQAEGVPGQGIWETSLQARDLDGNAGNGPEAFYDTVLDITWLRNADLNGLMTWDAAVTWAAGLDVNGIRGWRLPTMIDTGAPGCDRGTDCGFNVQTKSGDPTRYEAGQTVYSEMGHLYYVTLGNKPAAVCCYGGLSNTADFQNLLEFHYWYSLQDASVPDQAWSLVTLVGDQQPQYVLNPFNAMAVRTGDVVAVPEPLTGAMMLVGLGATVAAVRRRRRSAAQSPGA